MFKKQRLISLNFDIDILDYSILVEVEQINENLFIVHFSNMSLDVFCNKDSIEDLIVFKNDCKPKIKIIILDIMKKYFKIRKKIIDVTPSLYEKIIRFFSKKKNMN